MATFLTILFILICVLLIGIILLQKGRGGGLSGAFGGVGGHSAFGSRTGDMFTWITVVLVGLFLVVATAAVRTLRPAVATPAGSTTELEAPAEPAAQPATQPADQQKPDAPATQPADDDNATDSDAGEGEDTDTSDDAK